MAETEFHPNYLSVPSETIISLMRERDIGLGKLSADAGLPPRTVRMVLRGKTPIDKEIAAALEKALAVPAEFWLRRQKLFEQHRARLNFAGTLPRRFAAQVLKQQDVFEKEWTESGYPASLELAFRAGDAAVAPREKFFCCAPNCPGYEFRASDMRHPCGEAEPAGEAVEPGQLVTVCHKCYRASCWQGEFMCDEAAHAGTVDLPVGELRQRGLENPDWWDIDPDTGCAKRCSKPRSARNRKEAP
jgi:plasmid maintenance system antidote protein VapI